MNLYALPVVGRGGLGNMLLPWARAEIFARDHNASVLEPAWSAIRIGPYLRREPDKRRYSGFFRSPDHVSGLRRLGPMIFASRVPETEIARIDPRTHGSRSLIVTFRGLGGLFKSIAGEQRFVRDRLWQMTRPEMRGDAEQYGPRFIAMHIRRGDITRQNLTPGEIRAASQYAPLEWYAAMIRQIRDNSALRYLPVIVFSDGSEDEVKDLLGAPNVLLHRRAAAIADMWTISRACLLFAGGASTFAMWASYLGAMPTIYAPGKLLQRVQADQSGSLELEIGEDGHGFDLLMPSVLEKQSSPAR